MPSAFIVPTSKAEGPGPVQLVDLPYDGEDQDLDLGERRYPIRGFDTSDLRGTPPDHMAQATRRTNRIERLRGSSVTAYSSYSPALLSHGRPSPSLQLFGELGAEALREKCPVGRCCLLRDERLGPGDAFLLAWEYGWISSRDNPNSSVHENREDIVFCLVTADRNDSLPGQRFQDCHRADKCWLRRGCVGL